jgi:tetratricopeptide (TPR) repeat protein
LKVDKHFAYAHNNIGMVDFSNRKYKGAIKHFKRALKVNPAMAAVEANLGHAYFARKKYDDAFAAFGRALGLDPLVFERGSSASGALLQDRSVEDRAFYHYFIAKSYAVIGDAERCAANLRKALDEGYPRIADVAKDPAFAAVLEDPLVQQVLQRNQAIAQSPS